MTRLGLSSRGNDLSHGKGLAGPGNPQKDMVFVAGKKMPAEQIDRLGLIAPGNKR